ncbi:MAG: sugar transferase [Fimbriimonadaceae bacterium]|nr:sugar transferase [Fimbriimonadaceae bacterium]
MTSPSPDHRLHGTATPAVRRRWLDRALQLFGVLGDVAALQLALVLAYWIRFRSGVIPVTKGEPLSLVDYHRALWAINVVWLLVFAWLDMYRPQRWVSALDEAYRVLIAAGAVLLVLMAASFLYRNAEFSRLTVALAFAIAVLLVVLLRAVGLRLARQLARQPQFRRRVAVLGEVATADLCRGQAREVVFESPDGPAGLATVRDLLARGEVDELLLARAGWPSASLLALLREAETAGAAAILVADPVDLLVRRGGREDWDGLPLVRLRDVPLDGAQRSAKRLFDLLAAALLLLLLGPLLLLLALLVRLTSPGPVIFSQERVTEGGRRFRMHKFRSMIPNAEAQTGPVWARRGDPRVTPLGGFLRKTSLDELPQLWNILVGEMSLIGPRPERPVFVEQFGREIPRYHDRHRMKTGLTGWAQTAGERGGDSDIALRTRYDLYYIDNWSLMLDAQILVKTFFEVFFHRGAG